MHCQHNPPSGVTRVGVTRGGNSGCHPYFSWKKLTTFLVITFSHFCGVIPIYFLLKNWRPFSLITVTFIDFTRTFFYLSDLVCPLFFVNLPAIFFHSGVTPWRVSPGAVRHLPPPSDATEPTELISRTLLSSCFTACCFQFYFLNLLIFKYFLCCCRVVPYVVTRRLVITRLWR